MSSTCLGLATVPMAARADEALLDVVPEPPVWGTVEEEAGLVEGGYIVAVTLPGADPTDTEPRVNPGCQVTASAPEYDFANRWIFGVVAASCDSSIVGIKTRGFLDVMVDERRECQGSPSERCAMEQQSSAVGTNTKSATAKPIYDCDPVPTPQPGRCRGYWRTRGFVEFTFEHPVRDSQIPTPKWYYSCFRDQSNAYVLKCHIKTPKTTPREPGYLGCAGRHCVVQAVLPETTL